jgi:hypothetical protein
LACCFMIFLIVMQEIHPTPTKLTLQKDSAELSRLETQLRPDDDSRPETAGLPPAATSNAGRESIYVQPEEHSEFEAPKSALIASNMSSTVPKKDADTGEAKKHPGPFKRGMKARPDYVRNLQSQRALARTRQQYKQQGLGSFFSAMGRALGFSHQREPL